MTPTKKKTCDNCGGEGRIIRRGNHPSIVTGNRPCYRCHGQGEVFVLPDYDTYKEQLAEGLVDKNHCSTIEAARKVIEQGDAIVKHCYNQGDIAESVIAEINFVFKDEKIGS